MVILLLRVVGSVLRHAVLCLSLINLTPALNFVVILVVAGAFTCSVEMMSKIPNEAMYNNFAYHVGLLQDFGSVDIDFGGSSIRSNGRRKVTSRGQQKRLEKSGSHGSLKWGSVRMMTDSNNSVRSNGSLRLRNTGGGSLRGGNVFGNKTRERSNSTYSGGQQFAKGGIRRQVSGS
jgi:hypothetical protein